MAHKGFSDELARALARPDAGELRNAVEVYHRFFQLSDKDREVLFAEHGDVVDLFTTTSQDPDLGIALVALAASMFDDRNFMFPVAAGPLEDILREHNPGMVERVVAEARLR